MNCAVFGFDDRDAGEPVHGAGFDRDFDPRLAGPAANRDIPRRRWKRAALAAAVLTAAVALLASTGEPRWAGIQPVPGYAVTGVAVPAY